MWPLLLFERMSGGGCTEPWQGIGAAAGQHAAVARALPDDLLTRGPVMIRTRRSF